LIRPAPHRHLLPVTELQQRPVGRTRRTRRGDGDRTPRRSASLALNDHDADDSDNKLSRTIVNACARSS
jgi:hypothetical protein